MNHETVRSTSEAQAIHGVSEVPLEAMMGYGQALLTIVGGDGEISPAEWKHFEQKARAMGAPDPAIEFWRSYDFRSGDLKQLLGVAFSGGVPEKKTARVMLYDAICMSMADGAYAEGERRAADKAAALLGLEEPTLRAIEGIAQLERTLGEMRLAVFNAG